MHLFIVASSAVACKRALAEAAQNLLTCCMCIAYLYAIHMQLTINNDDRRPVYRQIADGIKTLIAKGDLREGATLPPVRQLAADLGVNLNTIAVAYRELQEEGLLVLKPGSGAKVAVRGDPPKRATEDMLRPLRAVLTEFVLVGIPRREILNLVDEELRGLLKGVRS